MAISKDWVQFYHLLFIVKLVRRSEKCLSAIRITVTAVILFEETLYCFDWQWKSLCCYDLVIVKHCPWTSMWKSSMDHAQHYPIIVAQFLLPRATWRANRKDLFPTVNCDRTSDCLSTMVDSHRTYSFTQCLCSRKYVP